MTVTPRMLVAAGAIAAVLAAVAGGISLLRTPAEERLRRIDDRRVEDLRALADAIDVYRSRRLRLPATLDDVASEPGLAARLRDPETQEPYTYRALGKQEYELCARFAAERPARETGLDFWAHGAGPQCFRVKARDLSH